MVSAMYALQDVHGKGKGLVATEKIPKGTRILCEEAIITINESSQKEQLHTSIRQQVDSLSADQKKDFLSMHNIHPYKNTIQQYLGIIRTNGLPAQLIGDKGAIFLEACRINHACDNNAQKDWNERINRHTVHALRDIEQGEEITITYLSPVKTRKDRQKALQARFGFDCLCHLCSLSPEDSQKSDKRLEAIQRLDNVIDQLGSEGVLVSPLRTLRYFDQQIRLYLEQGREDVGLAQTIENAAQLVIANSDLARGRILAERVASIWKTLLGSDSAQAIKWEALAKNPRKYELFGVSKKWSTKVDELPQGLGSNDFENWLWRREKLVVPGQPANLRNREIFPSFDNLPGQYDADSQHQWWFLGEIMGSSSLHHLELELKDLDGQKVPLHFYTKHRGREFAPAQLRKGYTVIISQAKRRVFHFGAPGIRHENSSMMKILPLSLGKLLALNDLVQQFSREVGGVRTCHGCGQKATSLQRCGKCSSFWYCNQACQLVGWNEKSHKSECKFTRNPDVRQLFMFQ